MRRFLIPVLGAALLAGCGSSEPTSETRVVVFGVDGLDPEELQERIDRGMLPNFARLVESGTFQPLQTSWPPQSPVSWSNFITGTNPGKHGLYDFIHVDRTNYGVLSSMSKTEPVDFQVSLMGYDIPLMGGDQLSTRQFPAFWEVMAEAGVPVYVHRMPANYPMPETTAVTFPDMGTPDLAGAASGKAFLWTEADGRQDKDSDSYYIRKVRVNRLALESASDGRAVVRVPLRMYGPPDAAKSIVRILTHEIGELGSQRRAAEEAGDVTLASELGNKIGELNAQMASEQEVFTTFDAYLDYTGTEPQVTVEIGDHYGIASVGEWTDWVPVEFSVMGGMVALSGYTRFLLKGDAPFELYASPVQVDPWNPVFEVSTPAEAAIDLADAIGPYYTQGFPDAYKAYKADLLNTAEFVSQSDTVFEERGKMMQYACDQLQDTGGCLFFYTGSLDMRSHMLWWAQDPLHPHQESAPGQVDDPNFPGYDLQLDRIYSQVDGMLGELVKRLEAMEADGMGPVELIVMSDHGFAPFRRKMHVNDWLVKEGYLVLKQGESTGMISASGHSEDGEIDWDSSIIDWSKSKAYVVGFNGIILNRVGREAQGIVTDAEADALLVEIRDKLNSLRDEDGTPVFTSIKKATEVFTGPMVGLAPDLQLGFNVGYGASDETAVGEITGDGVIVDNDSRWSGSHLMDPELVKGTIIVRSGETLSMSDPALEDITATLYKAFRVAPPADMDGKPLF
jgi:predicted AlkP superfamily phosphohydrolase/phosphomutase